MNKYIVVIESKNPPQLFLGDDLAGGKIIELKKEALPNRVTAAWLMERYNLSRKTIIDKLRPFNRGDENKHLYSPSEVMPILDNLNALKLQRDSRRKN